MNGLDLKMAVVAVAAAMFATVAGAQQPDQHLVPQQEAARQAVQREIVVSLEDRKLALIENGAVRKVYTVAVGKPSTPSPEGTFTIQRRVANPTYSHNGKTVAPGPNNPVGSRWMGLSKAGYGIHGTNEPKSIGKAASHGCIRMGRADLEEFYTLVAVGDTVRLIGHRDEETARLFGPSEAPAAGTQAAETARIEAAPSVHAVADPVLAATTSEAAANTAVVAAGTR